MIKNATRSLWVFIIMSLSFQILLAASSQYDREITVRDNSRSEQVQKIFREMMDRYEEKDLEGFFSYVSEDRFLQDYMTFYEAIEKDMREYDTLSIDTWIDKITDDGVKRFLYVKWEKRYDKVDSDKQVQKLGYSRFLFDEINGKYKLIELAGNNFWGESLPEWREEVPPIAGQEKERGDVDLVVTNLNCTGLSTAEIITFDITNESSESTSSGVIKYLLITDGGMSGTVESYGEYNGDIGAHVQVSVSDDTHYEDGYCNFDGIKVVINPHHEISELDYNNNCVSSGVESCP